jgi:predicted nucleic acid-binding protein
VEFVRFALHKKQLPLADVQRILADWRSAFPILLAADDDLGRTFQLLAGHELSVWDAHMLAICAANGCDVLLSEDMTDGALYGSVRVINPFDPHNADSIRELLTQ